MGSVELGELMVIGIINPPNHSKSAVALSSPSIPALVSTAQCSPPLCRSRENPTPAQLSSILLSSWPSNRLYTEVYCQCP